MAVRKVKKTTQKKVQSKKAKAPKKKAPKKKASKKNGKPSALAVSYRPLEELETWERNPKLHDIDGIRGSIRRFGFTAPIVIDESTDRIVAGHGRREALFAMQEAGEEPPKNIRLRGKKWLVPVVVGNRFSSEEEAEKYLIADNRFVEVGGWDTEMLLDILDDMDTPDLEAIGWDESSIAKMEKAAEDGKTDGKLVQFVAGEKEQVQHECPKCGHMFME
jgi:ParB-like chromosome segregation protein Spo0J